MTKIYYANVTIGDVKLKQTVICKLPEEIIFGQWHYVTRFKLAVGKPDKWKKLCIAAKAKYPLLNIEYLKYLSNVNNEPKLINYNNPLVYSHG